MHSHWISVPLIIYPDKGYSEKEGEDNDLETDEEDGEDGEIIQNRFKNGYQLWDLGKTTELEDESRQEVSKDKVETDGIRKWVPVLHLNWKDISVRPIVYLCWNYKSRYPFFLKYSLFTLKRLTIHTDDISYTYMNYTAVSGNNPL